MSYQYSIERVAQSHARFTRGQVTLDYKAGTVLEPTRMNTTKATLVIVGFVWNKRPNGDGHDLDRVLVRQQDSEEVYDMLKVSFVGNYMRHDFKVAEYEHAEAEKAARKSAPKGAQLPLPAPAPAAVDLTKLEQGMQSVASATSLLVDGLDDHLEAVHKKLDLLVARRAPFDGARVGGITGVLALLESAGVDLTKRDAVDTMLASLREVFVRLTSPAALSEATAAALAQHKPKEAPDGD